MFEVGKDVFKKGFSGSIGDVTARKRLRFIYSLFILAFAIFTFRTLWLGIQGTDRARLSGSEGVWMAKRADIIDRNGDILAKNIMSGHITLRPQSVKKPEEVANIIHKALPYEYSLSEALQMVNSSRRFIYVKKYASEAQRNMVINAKLQGLEIEPIQTRKYPKRRLFSHVIGFVGSDGHGLEGIERVYDDYLNENKDPLQLSLDARIQSVFYEQLSLAMQKYQAKAVISLIGKYTDLYTDTPDENPGYSVYDESGKAVYGSQGSGSGFSSYLVQVSITDLNIRKGPGTNYGKTGKYTGEGVFTIVEEANGQGASRWGKLKSGAGWISLDYAKRI